MFSNMKISVKLMGGFAVVILLSIALGLASIFFMRELASYTKTLYESPYTVNTALREANSNIIAIHRSMKDVAMAKTPDQIRAAQAQIDKSKGIINERMKVAAQIYRGDKADIAQITEALAQWDRMREATIALSLAGKKEEAAQVTREKGNAQVEKISALMDKMIQFAQSRAKEYYDEAIEIQSRIYMTIAAILGVVILASAGIALCISRDITSGIGELLNVCGKIAGGDLRESVRVRGKDEIAQLGTVTNRMADNMRGLIAQIQKTSEQVAASSEELTASSEQSAQVTENIAASITEVSSMTQDQVEAVNSASGSMNTVAAGIEESSEIVHIAAEKTQEVVQTAKEGTATIDGAVRQMNSIEETVNQLAVVVAKLGERSKEIGNIVDTISGIAGQTNLLALNAAIEAARAGESGKGFAVVAEEVRKLAEQSQEAAKEIEALITEIQGDTDHAVAAMDKGTHEVKAGADVVKAAGSSFSTIYEMVDVLNQQALGMAEKLKSLAGGTRLVVTSVEKIDASSKHIAAESQSVSAATEEQSAAMEEMAASSRVLAQLAQDLTKMTGRFHV